MKTIKEIEMELYMKSLAYTVYGDGTDKMQLIDLKIAMPIFKAELEARDKKIESLTEDLDKIVQYVRVLKDIIDKN